MTDQRHKSAAETYWESVEAAAQSTHDQKRWRAQELLRLKAIAQEYRNRWFPELPELTIEAIPLGGHSSAMVDKLGGWGQGISIRVKHSRIDPFHWPEAHAEIPTMATAAKDRSLVFGAPLRMNPQGEQLRQFEAELLILQQLLRAEQHRAVEVQSQGWADAKSDLKSWGGNGAWFANEANRVWKEWCSDKGFPFHPVRHSRANYEGLHECIKHWESHHDDAPLTFIRQSCSKWPAIVMGQAREVDLQGECPDMIGAEDYATAVTPEQWARWKQEQGQLLSALIRMIDPDVMQVGMVWPDNQVPEIDEIDGESVVSMPAKEAAIPMSRKVDLNYNPGDALRLIEAVFKPIDVDRGLTLWPDFLQLAADHPESPKASRVQTELAVDLDDEPTPIERQNSQQDEDALIDKWWKEQIDKIRDLLPWVAVWEIGNYMNSECEGSRSGREMGALVDSSGVAVKLACTGCGVNDRDIRISKIIFSQLSGHRWLFCDATRKEDSSGWTQQHDSLPGYQELLEQLIERLTPGESIEEPTPIEAGEDPAPVAISEPEATTTAPTEIAGFELLQAVTHKQFGQGVITRLYPARFGMGNASVDFDGVEKIRGLSELTPLEAGEPFTAQRWPTPDSPEIEPDDSEPSQSQLRKEPEQAHHDGLPAWPTNSRTQGKGLRVRATHEQVAVLEEQIQVRLDQGVKPAEIKRELAPWCGQSESTLAIRIRQIRTRVEAGQEVAA